MTRSGTAWCIAAALLYGTSLPLSRLLFDAGTNPLTLGLARYLLLALVLGVWVRWVRRFDAPMAVRDTAAAAAVGGLFAMVSVGQLLAIQRISVTLTTLLFYTYPALTIVVVALRRRARPGRRQLAVVLMASLGLALALNVELARMDLAGVLFALLAAASVSASFVVIEARLSHADPVRAAAGSALGATLVSAITLALFEVPELPASAPARALMAVVMVLFAAAVLCMYVGVARAGSVRAALVLFLEPVTAIVLAVALLGESLSALQCLGAALVVVAVAFSAGPEP